MATRCRPRLSYYHYLLQRTVLQHQDPGTGLIPSQKYDNHAWVRDNVYGALAIWALSLAYRKNTELDEDRARTYELERRCVMLMRGLLVAMMQQMDKLERFKETHSPEDSLHAKYNSTSGATCVGDDQWGHLQLDATSLFLLALAQITASGLQVVYNLDEVAFVQNLVFYIEEAYCTPDFGMWERGDKTNRGIRELNSSSVGLAKAALEALNDLDLFGGRGGPSSVVHVLSDEAQECDAVLMSMLPRESSSKEVDASLISVISFPAFAVTDAELIELTRCTIVDKLQGEYGMKRFLRDGYKTAREDRSRLYYEPWELQGFENIECEWPLFFCYMMIDACYRGDRDTMDEYSEMLERLCIRTDEGLRLIPEIYVVQPDKVNREAAMPHSEPRLPAGEIPFLWAQSLYIVAHLLQEEFVSPGEMDPLNRRLGMMKSPDVVVQIALLAENSAMQEKYYSLCPGIQKLSEVNLMQIHPARTLGQLYNYLGRNRKLGLTGRTGSEVGLLATSKLYSLRDELFVFTPQNLDSEEFHLVNDVDLFVSTLRSDIAVLRSHWHMLGRPTMVVILRQRQMRNGEPPLSLRQTIKKLHSGYINGTRVCLGRLGDFLNTSCVASLDFLGNAEEGEPEVLPPAIQEFLDSKGRQTAAMRAAYVPSHIFAEVPSGAALRKSTVTGIIRRSRSIPGQEHTPPEDGSAGSSEAYDEPSEPSRLMSRRSSSIEGSLSPPPPHKSTSELHLDQVAEQELLVTLRQTDSLEEQGDILHYLAMRKGLSWDTGLGKPHSTITVRSLFQEFYEHAVDQSKWALVRHFASALGKRVEDLAKCVTDLLVRQKQLTVGMPPHSEEVITRPLPIKELRDIIAHAHKGDQSTAMLTQELLAYLAMLIRARPRLFSEMQRLRVGLIIQVMVGEVARMHHCPTDDAADILLGLSPYEMQSLLLDIISGKEREEGASPHGATSGTPSLVSPRRRSVADVFSHSDYEESSLSDDTQGLWLRRRRLDGTLNRVPVGFYSHVWFILQRCPGVWVRGYCLPQGLTKEMTNGEIKFALRVEEMLNMVAEPEYRQLLVEALMVISLTVENDTVANFRMPIDVETIVQRANGLFLDDQRACQGNATLCCTSQRGVMTCQSSGGICEHFYDSAPSGMFGTMTYLMRSVAYVLPDVDISLDCIPS
ncbi:probable phosphorylase b kinase regulatory subunit alpha [Dermacentor albipictus]|uniref:probable phosphorylase b kinase regulatory subunit alpha n=1 Tax=Dermacentor albipictus TaxID=60249 RepID=UPI0038FC5690